MTVLDKIEILDCGSLIQHGPMNDRVYLLKPSQKNIISLPAKLIHFAKHHKYGKIFTKVNEKVSLPFLQAGFTVEARIPRMYPSKQEGIFLSYYLKENRKQEMNKLLYETNLKLALKKKLKEHDIPLLEKYRIRKCSPKDISMMQEVYKKVFQTYPFPIHDTSYLFKTMNNNVDYFCIENDKKIIALSSAEKDENNAYAEMTDFATLPDWRGHGFALILLNKMERSMKKQGITTTFTIARSASPGMNITFAKAGYDYAGRLKNNTNISGKIESMNIWYKKLSKL
jgi:putative beta-lysine N-acetyltransferase